MKRIHRFILGMCVLGLCGSALAAAPVRALAVSGSTPIGGARLSVIGAPQIDNAGRTLVTCRIEGPGVVALENDIVLLSVGADGVPMVLARTGASANLPGVSAHFVSSFYPRLARGGSIYAVNFLAGASITSATNTGVWSMSPGGPLSPVFQSGVEGVPGIPGAAFGGFVAGFPAACSEAGFATVAQLAPGPFVTADDFIGLWASDPQTGRVELVARTGVTSGASAPPAGQLPGASYLLLNNRSLAMSATGRVAMNAGLRAGLGGVTFENDTVIIERVPAPAGTPVAVAAREGAPVPGHGGLAFWSLDTSAIYPASLSGGGGGLSINSLGDMAFVDTSSIDIPPQGASRVWRRSRLGRFSLLAQRGAQAPGLDGAFFDVLLPPSVDAQGRVVFAAEALTSAGARTAGVWLADAEQSPRLIARSGVSGSAFGPPTNIGERFSPIAPVAGSVRFAPTGHVLIQWSTETEATVGTPAFGLFSYAPGRGIEAVVRAGDPVTIAPGDARVVRTSNAFIGPAGDDDGRLTNVNAQGQVALTLRFVDGSGALAVATLPGVGACCNGATCSVALADACSSINAGFAGEGTVCPPVGSHGSCCSADFDKSGFVTIDDIFIFLNAWSARSPSANISGNRAMPIDDVFIFLNAWMLGC